MGEKSGYKDFARNAARTAFTAGSLFLKSGSEAAKEVKDLVYVNPFTDFMAGTFYNFLNWKDKILYSTSRAMDSSADVLSTAANYSRETLGKYSALGTYGVASAGALWTGTAARALLRKAFNLKEKNRTTSALNGLGYMTVAAPATALTSVGHEHKGDALARTLEGLVSSVPETFSGLAHADLSDSTAINAYVATLCLMSAYDIIGKGMFGLGHKE